MTKRKKKKTGSLPKSLGSTGLKVVLLEGRRTIQDVKKNGKKKNGKYLDKENNHQLHKTLLVMYPRGFLKRYLMEMHKCKNILV